MDTLAVKKLLRNVKLRKYMALVFACGILLMAFSDKFQKPSAAGGAYESVKKDTADESGPVRGLYDSDLENRLEQLFGQIDGAGKVKVMITYKSGPEKVVATETKSAEDNSEETDSSGSSRLSKSISSEVKMAYSSNSSANGEPFIVKENVPELEGIVVGAQGGGDIMVKEAISKAAQALFNVPAHKVEVLKMGV